jgi:peptidyl-Lys metalloendopeptidase
MNASSCRLSPFAAVLLLLTACGLPASDDVAGPGGEGTLAEELRQANRSLQVSLSADRAAYAAGDAVLVTVTVTNTGKAAARVLGWYLPGAEVEEDVFSVTRDGQPVEYLGPHYKRPAADELDYLRLSPGQSVSRTVDLAALYDFSATGAYAIRYEATSGELHGPGRGGERFHLSSNAVAAQIEGRPSIQAKPPPSDGPYNRCDATQISLIQQAVAEASRIANESVSYLSRTPSATPRYTTWFGAFSTSGWNTASSHFQAIRSAVDAGVLTFDCGCKQQYYAYVYPNQPYRIYLCRVFWSAPMSGTDSKSGTLIHETSHFNVVAGTDDHAYGQTACRELALSDPTRALNNADSHEYFAENTPPLQ